MVIIADDLSGAADCGIACTTAGYDTLVVLGEREDEPECRVLAVDADTRGRSSVDAGAESARLVRLHGTSDRILFRKVDSTLRGHVATELAATLATRRTLGPAIVVLAPAFPATGRTTREGIQLLNGIPLEQTDIWRRERMQGRAFLPEMMASAGLHSATTDLATVRGGRLAGAMAVAVTTAIDVLCCDAESEDDLRRIAQAGATLGRQVIWAGSAGLARHVPDAMLEPRAIPCSAGAPVPAVSGPILFVIGSLSTVSARQVALLAECPDVEHLLVPPAVLRAGAQTNRWREIEHALDAALATGHDVVVSLGVEPDADPRDGLVLCHALASLTAPHASRIGALVSAGGETARAVLLAFRAAGLRLCGEIEPGVPLSLAEGWRHLPVVTKAGAFGSEQTFLRCRALLHAGYVPNRLRPESVP